ncbi:MAG TPA: YndJ family transporter [Candidatus Acidoferrum sp.]|nr:YndJ family transporter [Candidatus Acidoferrum sp.]
MRDVSATRRSLYLVVVLGAIVWFVLVAGTWSGWPQLGVIELLFLLAPWIVVPLANSLIPSLSESNRPGAQSPSVRWIIFAAAALATLSFFLPAEIFAASAAGAWLLVCAFFAARGLRRLWHYRANSFSQFCFAAGEAYLIVGGSWLVASRLGLNPVGFQEPIVLLTAVHFHFAGFLSAVLAGLTYERLRETRWSKPLSAALTGVVIGPGLLGLAFLVGPKVKLAAVILIVVGQVGLAAGMVRVALGQVNPLARVLLMLSGGCIAAGMILAASWALGEYPLQSFVELGRMERIHGTLNAIGFGICGLIGWMNAAEKT